MQRFVIGMSLSDPVEAFVWVKYWTVFQPKWIFTETQIFYENWPRIQTKPNIWSITSINHPVFIYVYISLNLFFSVSASLSLPSSLPLWRCEFAYCIYFKSQFNVAYSFLKCKSCLRVSSNRSKEKISVTLWVFTYFLFFPL